MARTILCVMLMFFYVLVSLINVAQSAEFTVGDGNGWSFSFDEGKWLSGKNFVAGDVLVFKYDPSQHNVFAADAAGYNSCTPTGSRFTSGNDRIPLNKGDNYFLCGIPGHCAQGMKLAVKAA